MRPHVSGESRNCTISQSSSATCLLFAPICTLQYVATLAGAVITVFLLSQLLTSITDIGVPFLTITDPNIKVFACLFGVAALAVIANMLSKPVRALEFNKSMGVFWIEKRRAFGWKIGESAQMPLSQIYALQILSYKKHNVNSTTENNSSNTTGVTNNEINVVFRNGERVNIINHLNSGAIRRDAGKLAEFLSVPVWDRDIDKFQKHEEPVANVA